MKNIKKWWLQTLMISFLVFPASTNYKLEGFSLGNAGGGDIGSSNYSVNANAGEMSGQMSGGSYDLGAGLAFVIQANAPKVASFTNPANYYNKLHFVVGAENNPSDTKYAVAISPDNFVTTFYVKSDNTVGTSLAMTDYQTYSLWGSTTGVDVVGLQVGTTYTLKIKAMQGKFTETGWGPAATAATVNPILTFDIDVAATDVQTTPPYIINFGDLFPGSVVTGNDKVWVSMDTNAASGGSVFMYGQNGGLRSATAGYLIASVNGDLNVLSSGFGIQGVGSTWVSGSPFIIDVGYTGGGEVVGIIDTTVRQIMYTNGPIVSGRSSFLVKARSDNDAPSAGDYTETLTVIAAANY